MRLTRNLFLALVVVALSAGVVAGYLVDERGSEPSFVDGLVFIPTVMGKTEQEAVAALEAKGLKAKIKYARGTRPKSEGRVIG
jgi:beta-lactam-binding protein with PASTA domain